MAGTAATIFSPDALDKLLRFAEVMANGRVTVPAHLAGKPADCLAVTMQAAQWGMNPFAVAQKTFTINGTLGYEAQLVNAVVTTMAPTRDRLHYEWFGSWNNIIGNFTEKTSTKGNKYIAPAWSLADEAGCGVRVWATMKGEDEPRVLELLLSQAQVRNSTLWASDPKQQLAYLAVKRWARLHCPDVILGVYTPDELEHVSPAERDVTPDKASSLNTLINQSVNIGETQVKGNEKTDKLSATPGELLSGQGADSYKSESVGPLNSHELHGEACNQSGKPPSPGESDQSKRLRTPDELLADFSEAAIKVSTIDELARCYAYASKVLEGSPSILEKATEVFLIRKAELDEAKSKSMKQ
ncbi:recombinase RecT [Pantoea rwandensis]|nr:MULTISPECIES: RecT family recombinase [unclassified Pantoea]MCA1176668.1 recombinase RecT [Pantoea sp. alder69]MCA1251581.1 recombinase RecT [Pantoea sp. alder70]MCA1264288.1 recombinase RecT [Pantoea sp. alder81]